MNKYYYENILGNQNVTSKTNLVWAADITTLELFRNKAYVFLCIDIHTNIIVASVISRPVITSQKIIRSLEKALKLRATPKSTKKLIIHTDRGTQFSSKKYNQFTKMYEEYFCPSMTRLNTPTDNAVAERFVRTFKEHRINGTTIEEKLSDYLAVEPNFNSYRAVLNEYVRSLNNKPNKKARTSPQRHDKAVSTAALLMIEPKYDKAKSARIGKDFRVEEVEKFKAENTRVIGILADIAARKAEIVEKTPFDNYEDNIVLEIIDNRLSEIYSIIKNNPEVTKQYVEEVLEPIEGSLDELHLKVDKLLFKNKKQKETLPLRDPIDTNLFPLLFKLK